MKPLSSIQNDRRGANRRLPRTDCNYRSLAFSESNPCCGRTARSSFTAISRDYFNKEAGRHFVIETVGFALVTLTTIPAMFDCGRALLEFMHAISGT
jgi:hypothetical protein